MALAVAGLVWLTAASGVAAQDREGEGAPQAEPSVAEPSVAEPSVAEQSAATAQQAREHFLRGMEAHRAYRFRDAIQAFETAASLVPSADLWFNIARCYEDLGDSAPHAQERIVNYERATQNYQRYLRDRVDPPDREAVESHIQELGRRMEQIREASQSAPTSGTLQIRVDRDGAEVLVDDQSVGQSPLAEPLEISPGRHALRVRLDGFVPFVSEVSVEAGVRTAAFADLSPEVRYRAIQGDRIFTWIGFGLAGAALATSIGFGASAAGSGNSSEAAISDGLLGAAIGLATLGAILWFIEGRSVGTERLTVEDNQSEGMRDLSADTLSESSGGPASEESSSD